MNVLRRIIPALGRRLRDRRIIAASALFDRDWYLAQNPQVGAAVTDPLAHYLRFGAHAGLDPHPLFDTTWYLEHNPDVGAAGINPFAHYLARGGAEGRSPHPLFDGRWYLERNPDVRAAGSNPLLHYLQSGAAEGRDPNPLFDSDWYLDRNPEVCAAGENPLLHYVTAGAAQGRDPGPVFEGRWYLEQNLHVKAAGLNPLAHYLHVGGGEGLDPILLFDSSWYLERYPDVRAAGLNPLVHYLERGGVEGRNPHPLFESHWYLEQHPDVRAAGVNPLVHYLRFGAAQGHDPSQLFDSNWYLDQNPDVRASGTNPLVHYLVAGAAEGRSPNRLFKSRWYLEQNPQVRAAGMNPLVHYQNVGTAAGRDPNPMFDTDWYLTVYPGVASSGLNPLAHYLRGGAAQGFAPGPQFKGSWYLEQFPDRGAIEAAPQWPLRQSAVAPGHGGVSGGHSDDSTACDILADRADGPVDKLAAAIARAAVRRHHLLVAMTGPLPETEDVGRLAAALDADPMIGYVIPRFADASGLIHPLRAGDGGGASGYDPGILAHLPAMQLAPEFLAGCILLRRELVANFPDLVANFSTMAGLLRALMAWGRRLGYRAAIANHVVVANVPRSEALPALVAAEKQTLVRFFPDALVAESRFGELPCHRREALIDCALSRGERRMLIDCTGMQPYHNGTSECILGILDGLAAAGRAWQVDIMVAQATADYHGLRVRYPAFNVVGMSPEGLYKIAIRLSQPWTLESIAELHERALYIAFLMLDTIAWDIVYPASPEVERAWTFAAAHADGLLYDFAFTRDRFAFRFPIAGDTRELVSYLSCNFADHVVAPPTAPRGAGHILLVGNDHEHKGMAQALDLLPRAFPDETFVAIGHDDLGLANVRSVKSGKLSADDMEKFYADARMLVFPSFYEGFGFPIVKGLARGLDVVARRSDLLCEIAGQCAERGRVVPFDDPASLIDVVGRILAGERVETVSLGVGLEPGLEPPRWRDIASRIVTFVDDMTAKPSLAVRDRREAALRHVWPTGYSAFRASKPPQ